MTWTVNAQSWQFIPPKIVIGVVVALIASPAQSIWGNVVIGMIYGLLLNGLLLAHIIGHIVSSRFVAPAMSEARITPTLIETRFNNDPPKLAPRVHLTRSIGGIIMNGLLSLISFLLWQQVPNHFILYFAWANLILMLFVLLPFPSVDGGVIWRELRRWLVDRD